MGALVSPLWRSLFAILIAGALVFTLESERQNRVETERARILKSVDLSWSVSELITEGGQLSKVLAGYRLHLESAQYMKLRYDNFRKRVEAVDGALLPGLKRTESGMALVEHFIENAAPHFENPNTISVVQALSLQEDLDFVLLIMRDAWVAEFNSQSLIEYVNTHVGGDLDDWWRTENVIHLLMSLLGVYIFMEMIFANCAQRRERKLSEQAREAADHKSRFLANISHEIRTPLNGILGMAQHLCDSDLSKDQRQSVDVINDSGTVLLATIKDVLDLSKIDAGGLEIDKRPFEVAKAIRASMELYKRQAEAKGIDLDASVCAQTPEVIIGDDHRLRQILHNLISNAIKFTEEGCVRLAVDFSPGIHDRPTCLSITIADTGIGIPSDKLEQVFEPFRQADNTTSRTYGGTGLGLAISRELAQAMDGHLTVTSTLGQGTTFKLSLPVEVAGNALVDQEPVTRPVETPPRLALSVLGVDDNATNRLILKRFLESEVEDLMIVTSGQEAIDACAARHFDVVLMDVQMPGMTGLEAMRWIRDAHYPTAPMPQIIAVTANGSRADVSHYLTTGMDGVLTKPLSRSKLRAYLSDVVAGSALKDRVA